ncbi:hypothetical protein BH23GEM6_BH23GEM6_02310 [soil metagenome]
MHKAVEQFVGRMGMMLEADGMPRIAGRIFGFLLLNAEAYSLDELARQLRVSKASVSTNARLLEQLGIVERLAVPGDRRDYYRMGTDAWERMLRTAQRKWEVMRQTLREAEASLPQEMAVGRERLLQAELFHLLLEEESEQLIVRWRQKTMGNSTIRADKPAA